MPLASKLPFTLYFRIQPVHLFQPKHLHFLSFLFPQKDNDQVATVQAGEDMEAFPETTATDNKPFRNFKLWCIVGNISPIARR